MRKTKQDAELTRQEILRAAAALFSSKGFAKSSLEEIARAANVTRGAVYWHFKNKAEIFDALHELLYLPLIERVRQDLEADHPNPLEQLRDFCINLMLGVEEDKQVEQMLTLFLMKHDYSGELAEYRERHCQRKLESLNLFQLYFEKAQRMGKLPMDAEIGLMSKSVNYFVRGIISEYFEYPEKFNLKEKVPKLLNFFFLQFGCSPNI